MLDENYKGSRGIFQRYIPFVLFLAIAIILCAVVINIDNISQSSATIIRSLVWPFSIVIIVVLFLPHIDKLLIVFISKVREAAKLSASASGIIIESGPRQIPVPDSGEPVTLMNVALLHTSFLRSDKTLKFNDGLNYYQIEVIVVAPQLTLDRIVQVTYRFDASYPKQEYTNSNRQDRFKIKELANGSSIIRAEIRLKGQDEPVYLNRFIDLRPDGPRI